MYSRVLVGKREGKRLRGRVGGLTDSIKMDLKRNRMAKRGVDSSGLG